MTTWNQQSIHKNMHVYSADNIDLGHVVAANEDSFTIHKGIFAKERYLPYESITNVDNNQIQLSMSSDEVGAKQWEVRPDYENHLGDPTQLMYDRGHGVRDPFNEESKPPQQA